MTELRPWGSFSILDEGNGYKVKRLVVLPGKRFSLQYHLRRAEHWTIVAGTGLATCGEQVLEVAPNDHIYIEKGTLHRLENPAQTPHSDRGTVRRVSRGRRYS